MPPPGTIAILEDCNARIAEMRACLRDFVPASAPIVITDNAHTLIVSLRDHLHETALISLDHDLPLYGPPNATNHGDGRMVADYLAALTPTCPVIIHSSNEICATGMFYALQYSGWPVSCVIPYDGEKWIKESWAEHIQKYIRDGWLTL